MNIIRDPKSHTLGPSVITIGSFDGLHLGHQALLQQLQQKSAELSLPAVLVTFDPSPAEVFSPEKAPARLMRLREKIAVLKDYGVDEVLVLRFNKAMAQLTPEQFVQQILVDGLQTKHVLIGDDFRYGKARAGDYTHLQAMGEQHGFTVAQAQTVSKEQRRVSSSWVRELIKTGEFDTVHQLLGRPYANQGHIVRGAQLGRKLGFPTANIPMRRLTSPLHGIYVVDMLGIKNQPLPGVASVGTRPVVNGVEFVLEVHLFDFDEDIYGRLVEVRFYQKLRDEWKFDSLDALTAQMKIDCEQARAFFL